jgi:hypothetical protein
VGVLGGRSNRAVATRIVLSSAAVVVLLGFPLPHADVTANSDTATLVSDHLAERRALHQAWELLGAKNDEWLGLDLHSPVDSRRHIAVGWVEVEILFLLGRLKQAERQLVQALVADG